MLEFRLRQVFLTVAILLSSGAQDDAAAASSSRILGVAWTSLDDLQELAGQGSTLRHVAPGVAILGDASTKGFGKQRSAYQEMDYVSLFKPVTKRVMRVERADSPT